MKLTRILSLCMLTCGTAAMAQPPCRLDTIRGTYAVSYSGFITPAPGTSVYVTILGVMSIDQGGNLNGAITFSGLTPQPLLIVSGGTVKINDDCTGVLKLGAKGGPATETDLFVFDRDTRTLWATAVQIAVGPVASIGTWKMISPLPRAASWPPAE